MNTIFEQGLPPTRRPSNPSPGVAKLEAATVVARPDEKWAETPCAFVTLQPGVEVPSEKAMMRGAGDQGQMALNIEK